MIKQKSIVVKNSESTLQYAEIGEIVVNAGADCVITLPTPNSGLWYRISNVGVGIVSVIYNNVELTTLKQAEQCLLLANGTTDWFLSKGGGGGASVEELFSDTYEILESFEGGDSPFTLSGPWYVTDTHANTGTKCLRSSSVTSGNSEEIITFTSNAGEFSFWYMYQTESGYDKFFVKLDGVEVLSSLSGTNLTWTQYVTQVEAGEHTLSLRYYKDGSSNVGLDAVFVDDLRVYASVEMADAPGFLLSVNDAGDGVSFIDKDSLTEGLMSSSSLIDGGDASTIYTGESFIPIKFRLYPTKDTSTYQASSGTNYGTANNLQTGGYSSYFMRSYLHFDLSKIPVGKVIKSAKLYLYKIYINSSGASHTYTIRRITSDWGEGTLTYGNAPSFSDKYGTTVYTFGAINSFSEHDVTEIIQDLVNGLYPNYGVCSTWEGSGSRQNSQWASREHADSSLWPYLEIEYM